MSEAWLDLLRTAVDRLGSIQAVANLVGVSRAAVSTAIKEKYPAGTKNLEIKVLRKLAPVGCPHLDEIITFDQCTFNRTRAVPSGNADKFRHWVACQGCPVGDRLGLPRNKNWDEPSAAKELPHAE